MAATSSYLPLSKGRHPRFMSGSRPTPTDIVLTQLDDEADSFKYISNVVNPSFLHLELLDGSVKI